MKQYDKIVRHRIPQLIKDKGGECKIEVINAELEGKEYLKSKLQEEALELMQAVGSADILEEMGDVFAVLQAFCMQEGITIDQLALISEAKRLTRGDFNSGGKYVILKESSRTREDD